MATLALTGLGEVSTLLANSLQVQTQWGIFDSNGNQLGVSSSGGNSLFQSIVTSAIFGQGSILSTSSFEYRKETRVSDFPVQSGGFASYNKVILPGEPTVKLAFAGPPSDRTNFFNQLDKACGSTALYSVVTPEVTYHNYNIVDYSYMRRREEGANLIVVELHLREIRQVSASYSTTPTPINQPQNPGANPSSSGGVVQPQQPDQSTLKSLTNNFPSLHF